MKVSIKYTNIGSSPAIDTYVEQKIGERDEFINIAADGASHGGETVEAFVEVGRTTTHHQKGNVFRAEVQIKMPGDKLELLRKAEELRQWRRTRHALEYPTCGRIFNRVALEDIKVGLC